MKREGGCYCGEVRYVAEGEPMMKQTFHQIPDGLPTFERLPPR
jgi:hypothetical protein